MIKGTGIIRRIDDLGRVAIPKEIRRTLHICEGDPLEICVRDGEVVLKKYFEINKRKLCREVGGDYVCEHDRLDCPLIDRCERAEAQLKIAVEGLEEINQEEIACANCVEAKEEDSCDIMQRIARETLKRIKEEER